MITNNNNPQLDNVDVLELIDRYKSLLKIYAELALELAPKLDKFGKLRKELQFLSLEFVKRGVQVEQPTDLVEIFEQALNNREKTQQKDVKP